MNAWHICVLTSFKLITLNSVFLSYLNIKTFVRNLFESGLDSINAFNLEQKLVKALCVQLSNTLW